MNGDLLGDLIQDAPNNNNNNNDNDNAENDNANGSSHATPMMAFDLLGGSPITQKETVLQPDNLLDSAAPPSQQPAGGGDLLGLQAAGLKAAPPYSDDPFAASTSRAYSDDPETNPDPLSAPPNTLEAPVFSDQPSRNHPQGSNADPFAAPLSESQPLDQFAPFSDQPSQPDPFAAVQPLEEASQSTDLLGSFSAPHNPVRLKGMSENTTSDQVNDEDENKQTTDVVASLEQTSQDDVATIQPKPNDEKMDTVEHADQASVVEHIATPLSQPVGQLVGPAQSLQKDEKIAETEARQKSEDEADTNEDRENKKAKTEEGDATKTPDALMRDKMIDEELNGFVKLAEKQELEEDKMEPESVEALLIAATEEEGPASEIPTHEPPMEEEKKSDERTGQSESVQEALQENRESPQTVIEATEPIQPASEQVEYIENKERSSASGPAEKQLGDESEVHTPESAPANDQKVAGNPEQEVAADSQNDTENDFGDFSEARTIETQQPQRPDQQVASEDQQEQGNKEDEAQASITDAQNPQSVTAASSEDEQAQTSSEGKFSDFSEARTAPTTDEQQPQSEKEVTEPEQDNFGDFSDAQIEPATESQQPQKEVASEDPFAEEDDFGDFSQATATTPEAQNPQASTDAISEPEKKAPETESQDPSSKGEKPEAIAETAASVPEKKAVEADAQPQKLANTKPSTIAPPKGDESPPVSSERVDSLEKELQAAQLLIQQLREKEEKAKLKDNILADLNAKLHSEMSKRAEAEDSARRAKDTAEKIFKQFSTLQGKSKEKIEQMNEAIASLAASKTEMQKELVDIREERDEQARKESSFTTRLNDAIKKVAVKANAADHYEDQVDHLETQLNQCKEQLSIAIAERKRCQKEVANWRKYSEGRTKQLEAALKKEKKLNEERKKKMKSFVEAKTEEVRSTKADNMSLQAELDQTTRSLKDFNQRYKQLHGQWVQAQTRNRESQRDMAKIKNDSEKMSKVGGTLEVKLSRSTQEIEDHKNKRLAAKKELMRVIAQLEEERKVNTKLKDYIRSTFTPKVLSQNQAMRENLDNFEGGLRKLALRSGRELTANWKEKRNKNNLTSTFPSDTVDSEATMDSLRSTISDAKTVQVLSKLEEESQRVNQHISDLTASVDQLNSLLVAPTTKGCVGSIFNF